MKLLRVRFWKAKIYKLNEIIKFFTEICFTSITIYNYKHNYIVHIIIKTIFEPMHFYFVQILIMTFKTCHKLHFITWRKYKFLNYWPMWNYRPTSTINLVYWLLKDTNLLLDYCEYCCHKYKKFNCFFQEFHLT